MKYKAYNCYSEDCPVKWEYSEAYKIVVDTTTNTVVCMLGEPEDRTFSRDLRGLLTILNLEAKE